MIDLETHRQWGYGLVRARETALAYIGQRPVRAHARRALKWIDRVRFDLDDELYRDHPGQFDVRIYYPGGDDFDRRAMPEDEVLVLLELIGRAHVNTSLGARCDCAWAAIQKIVLWLRS